MTRAVTKRTAQQTAVIITCEHGGFRIPKSYQSLFCDAAETVSSHRGWDPGALKLGKRFAADLQAPYFSATVTRLLVELNRSLGHPQLFSEFTQCLTERGKSKLLAEHWHPYRQEVQQAISNKINSGHSILHLSVHSFTPVWQGKSRKTDVGFLYDPARQYERNFCSQWRTALREAGSDLTVHRNAPYRGISDGFVTSLRREFPAGHYAGIELEVNQKFFDTTDQSRSDLAALLISSFRQTLLQLQRPNPNIE